MDYLNYLDTYTRNALIEQEAFRREHKTEYRQLPACSCGLKNSTIYHLIARLDLERLICNECRYKEELEEESEEESEEETEEESEEDSEEQGEERVSRKSKSTSTYKQNYIKHYPYLNTKEIARFIKKNPECLYDCDVFVGCTPLEYVERLHNSTQYLLLCPWSYTSPSESHRGDYVLDALETIRTLFTKQILKRKNRSG
jgi:hypothetical protein